MFDDDVFLSIISPYATVDLNTRDFHVSDPVQIDGVNTSINLVHKKANTINQTRTIRYRRYDVTGQRFTVEQNPTDRTISRLLSKLNKINLFKFRVIKDGKVECRLIKLNPSYFKDDAIDISPSGRVLVVEALPTCKWLIGSIELVIA